MEKLLTDISSCAICAEHLELGPRPVMAAHTESKIVIIGQAPGIRVHKSGVPWDDPSGRNLRNWMGISEDDFYNPKIVAMLPMGFCYPGKGKSGDLPPRPECAPQWHDQVLSKMKNIQLTILIGQYAQARYLGNLRKKTLTETVKSYQEYPSNIFVLPHPSPRNNIWKAKNPWFEKEVIVTLKETVRTLLID